MTEELTPFVGTPEEEKLINAALTAIIQELSTNGPMDYGHVMDRVIGLNPKFGETISNNGKSQEIARMAFYRGIQKRQIRFTLTARAKVTPLSKRLSAPDHVPDDLL